MSLSEDRPQQSRSGSHPKPTKGILKNAPPTSGLNGVTHLQWDEENIAATEIQKDSLMKIMEPKTPYVRYNAETDTIEGDIPNLDLGRRATSPIEDQPVSPTMTLSSTGADASGSSSRRTSFSSSGRPSTSMSQRSRSSSRSTSFNLPNEARHVVKVGDQSASGDETFDEVEMVDEEAAKKHAEFIRARGRHYSNEAEAMKRAAQLMAHDEDEDVEIPPVPKLRNEYSDDNAEEEGLESDAAEPETSERRPDCAKLNGVSPRGTA